MGKMGGQTNKNGDGQRCRIQKSGSWHPENCDQAVWEKQVADEEYCSINVRKKTRGDARKLVAKAQELKSEYG